MENGCFAHLSLSLSLSVILSYSVNNLLNTDDLSNPSVAAVAFTFAPTSTMPQA